LIPRYNGFFDPFGNSKLTELLLAGAARGGPGPSSPSNGGGGAGPTDGSGNQNEGGYGSMNGEKQGENDGKRSPSSTSQNVPQQQQYQQVQQQNQKSRYERFFNGKVPVIQMEQVFDLFLNLFMYRKMKSGKSRVVIKVLLVCLQDFNNKIKFSNNITKFSVTSSKWLQHMEIV
jgi:hypothetical protein